MIRTFHLCEGRAEQGEFVVDVDQSSLSDSSVLDVVSAALSGVTDIQSLQSESNLWDAGMDSLASVAVMVAVEDTFDIIFPDELLTREVFESAVAIAAAVRQVRNDSGTQGEPS
jgi:acyl carrier protein